MWSDLPDLPPLYHVFVYYIVWSKTCGNMCTSQERLLLTTKSHFSKNSSINSKQAASVSRNVRRQLVQAPFPCRCYVLCQALTHTRSTFQLRLSVHEFSKDLAFWYSFLSPVRTPAAVIAIFPWHYHWVSYLQIHQAESYFNHCSYQTAKSKFPALLY